MMLTGIVVWSLVLSMVSFGNFGAAASTMPDSFIRSSDYTVASLVDANFSLNTDWVDIIPWAIEQPRSNLITLEMQSRLVRDTGFAAWPLALFVETRSEIRVSGATVEFFDASLSGTPVEDVWPLSFQSSSFERSGLEGIVPVIEHSGWSLAIPWSAWNLAYLEERGLEGQGWISRHGRWMEFESYHGSSSIDVFRPGLFTGHGFSVGALAGYTQRPWQWRVRVDNLVNREYIRNSFEARTQYNTQPVWEERNGRLVRSPTGRGEWRYVTETLSHTLHLQAGVQYQQDHWAAGMGWNQAWSYLNVVYRASFGDLCLTRFPVMNAWKIGWKNDIFHFDVMVDDLDSSRMKNLGFTLRYSWYF